jgi:hypothetical protein
VVLESGNVNSMQIFSYNTKVFNPQNQCIICVASIWQYVFTLGRFVSNSRNFEVSDIQKKRSIKYVKLIIFLLNFDISLICTYYKSAFNCVSRFSFLYVIWDKSARVKVVKNHAIQIMHRFCGLNTLKNLLHLCSPGVGKWSKMGKILSTYLKNDPLNAGRNTIRGCPSVHICSWAKPLCTLYDRTLAYVVILT